MHDACLKGGKPPAPETEEFLWDGLALVRRGTTSYMNEPHPGGGAAVLSSKDGVMFNDILGTTLGVEDESGYTSTPLTAFGDTTNYQLPTANSSNPQPLFTGKPHVDGLGHAFLMRNYRAGLGKWLTADPLGYPDGWNQMAYCGNEVMGYVDYIGAVRQTVYITTRWMNPDGNGVGTPFSNVYKFMKDTWDQGSAVLGALGIRRLSDFIDAIGNALSDKVRGEVEDLLGTDQWLEAAILAAINRGELPLSYDRVPPTKADIDKAVGRTDYDIISQTFIGIVDWDKGDIPGTYFINGCDQRWKVVVEYE